MKFASRVYQASQAMLAQATSWKGTGRRSTSKELSALAESLTELNRFADSEFLELSRDLKALYASATGLAETIGARANSVREDLKQSRLNGEDGLAARALVQLEREFAEAGANLTSLSEMASALGHLNQYGREMERLATLLHVSGAGFAIESVRTTECRESFGTFVEELRSLAVRIANLGQAINNQARSAHQELVNLIPAIAKQLTRLRQLTRQSDAAARNSSAEMQQLLDSSQATLDRAEGHTRRIAAHAEDAVFCLQFGDILRQKLEHVVSTIEEAVSLSGTTNGEDTTRRIGQMLAIQTAQLELIHGEVQTASRQLSAAFGGIAEEGGRLAESLSELDHGTQGGSAGKPFDRLKTSLIRLNELQREGSEMFCRADASSRGAMDAASQLSGYLDQVQEINQQMQLQALNALIKTERLGRAGQTLGVLSMHVHEIFQESNESVEKTVAALQRVHEHSLRERSAGISDDASESGLEAGLRLLDQTNSALTEATVTAAELVQQQDQKFEQVRARIESVSALADRITAMIEQCAALRDRLGGSHEGWSETSELHDRYTMESERLVHQRLSGAAAGSATAAVATEVIAPPDSEGLQDNPDDNVEFF